MKASPDELRAAYRLLQAQPDGDEDVRGYDLDDVDGQRVQWIPALVAGLVVGGGLYWLGACSGGCGMPVVREPMSISVFCDEMGIDPKRFVGVEVNRLTSTVTLVLEPVEDRDGANEQCDSGPQQQR